MNAERQGFTGHKPSREDNWLSDGAIAGSAVSLGPRLYVCISLWKLMLYNKVLKNKSFHHGNCLKREKGRKMKSCRSRIENTGLAEIFVCGNH